MTSYSRGDPLLWLSATPSSILKVFPWDPPLQSHHAQPHPRIGLVYDDTYAYPIERMSGTYELPVIYDRQSGFFNRHHKDANVTCVDKLLTILQVRSFRFPHV
jgi:hypothetical protein